MGFIADKQTLDDLNLLGKYKSNSVYSQFNKVRTAGGEKLLEYMFRHPLTDAREINLRSGLFRYFQQRPRVFPFAADAFVVMENYLSSGGSGNRFTAQADTVRKKLMHTIGIDKEFPTLVAGLQTTLQLLHGLHDFLGKLPENDNGHSFWQELRAVKQILSKVPHPGGGRAEGLWQVVRYDTLLRHTLRNEMQAVLQFVYQLDVCIAVAEVATVKQFTYAQALSREAWQMQIVACRHPGIERAVANTVHLQQHSNVLFLTGANMAGKSTFMKSFAIAVYLAHMGFPVAAESMVFSVRDGLYTSINVPDNLQLGYSHFYAEVRRVKTVAEEVAAGKNLVVIFDELFKGTNVKDAYDATLAVTQAFAAYRNCFFIISTHIIEVADVLQASDNLQFVFFPTVMEGTRPRYTYRLQQGVTSDRHGMMIIEHEGIVDIIKGSSMQKVMPDVEYSVSNMEMKNEE